MNIENNKIYCKLGATNPDEQKNKIIGYFICFSTSPKYSAEGCNFDESTDFENAVVIDAQYLNLIHIGYSMIIDGQFIENKETLLLSYDKIIIAKKSNAVTLLLI